MSRSPWGRRLIDRLLSRRGLAIPASTALVAGALLAATPPTSAASTTSALTASVALDGTNATTPPHGKDGHKDGKDGHKKDGHKKDGHKDGRGGFGGCIDSAQQANEKFLVYVPERDALWVWKENRGAGTVDPWVRFTETAATNSGVPIPEGVVCATIVNKGNDVAITIVTQNNSDQEVWQTECTVNPDNANDPFDPNERCDDFEQLTPLPVNNVGGKDGVKGGAKDGVKDGVKDQYGPPTGDGATATSSRALGVPALAGGALLGLAVIVALLRKRPTT